MSWIELSNEMRKNSKPDAKMTSTSKSAKSTSILEKSASRLKLYAIPVIISIVLWYYLNSHIFKQVKHMNSRESRKILREKIVFSDEKVAKINLNQEIASVNYASDRRSNLNYNYLCALEDIEELIETNNLKQATGDLNKLAKKSDAHCPHLIYMTALLFDRLADEEKSSAKLKRSIQMYEKLLDMAQKQPRFDENLMYLVGSRLVERLEFSARINDAIKYTDSLLKTFANNMALLNRQGINYLIADRPKIAKEYFQKVLSLSNNNPVALCHLAFILKQHENQSNESIEYFKECLLSREKSVMDGRFFYHLGDALQRINRSHEAKEFYEMAVENGIFLSTEQRSIYNEKNLRAIPWWSLEETGYESELKELEENWQMIRLEAESQLSKKQNSFVSEDENLREKGDWKEFALFVRGKRIDSNCAKVPNTCKLIEKIEAAKTCKRGQVKFSLLTPGVHIWPHCGPTNCRIRAHLGLRIPNGVFLRVRNETRTWHEGEFIVFDDSFEHEVWHNGTRPRLVLIVDLWHPDLTLEQRSTLSPI